MTVMTEVPEPGAGIEVGLKVTVMPVPAPEDFRAIAALKPPETFVVIVEAPELPRAMVRVVGDAEMVKAAEVTVSDTVVFSVVVPEVPVTVIVYVPATVAEATTIFMVEVPAPVIDGGVKVTVTPVGWPVADSVTGELNPPVTVLVMVEVPEPPRGTDTVVGDAERLKPDDEPPARALIRATPFGLPHPVARSYPTVAQ